MTASAPFILSEAVVKELHALREFAAARPVNMLTLEEAMKTPKGKKTHLQRMSMQSIKIPGPWVFFVTFSVEIGHPIGACRHMSMSIAREKRVPSQDAVWMVAEHLGFSGGLDACDAWPEELPDGSTAVNVAQPLSVQQEGRMQ
jgi:hypothetical protein